MSANTNKDLIAGAFDAWANGTGSVFDLLADDVVWTVTGSSPNAGIYRSRQELLERAVKPIWDRLSEPIRPTVRTIVAEGDHIVVVWDGRAIARDGRPYDNTYCWVLRVMDGQVAEVTAFFDSPMLTDLLERDLRS